VSCLMNVDEGGWDTERGEEGICEAVACRCFLRIERRPSTPAVLENL